MGAIKDIHVGNIAVVDFTFHPTGVYGAVTSAGLLVHKSDGTEDLGFVTTLSDNNFRGSYVIPEAGPAGPWFFRFESTGGPVASGEQKFNVVGSAFTSP